MTIRWLRERAGRLAKRHRTPNPEPEPYTLHPATGPQLPVAPPLLACATPSSSPAPAHAAPRVRVPRAGPAQAAAGRAFWPVPSHTVTRSGYALCAGACPAPSGPRVQRRRRRARAHQRAAHRGSRGAHAVARRRRRSAARRRRGRPAHACVRGLNRVMVCAIRVQLLANANAGLIQGAWHNCARTPTHARTHRHTRTPQRTPAWQPAHAACGRWRGAPDCVLRPIVCACGVGFPNGRSSRTSPGRTT